MFPGPRSRETLRSGYGSQPGCHQIQGRRLFNPSAKRHQQQGPRLSMRPPYHAGRPPLTRRGHHGVRRGVRPGFQTPAGGPRKSRLTFAPQTQSPGQWGEHPGMPPPAAWRPRELLTHLRARLPQRPRALQTPVSFQPPGDPQADAWEGGRRGPARAPRWRLTPLSDPPRLPRRFTASQTLKIPLKPVAQKQR